MRLAIAFLLNFFALSLQAQWQGTSPLYFTAGNVGIGTSTPSSLLHLKSNSPTLQIQSTQSGGTAALNLINDSGNVGLSIGSYGSGYVNGANYVRANGVSLHTTSAAGASAGIAIAARNTTGYLTLHTGGDTERMRISAEGNVGIGTATPAFKLDIDGFGTRVKNSSTASGAYTTYRLQGAHYVNGLEIDFFGNNNISADLNWSYGGGPGSAAIVNVNPKPLTFATNNQGRMIIDADGNVGIGVPG